MSEIVELDDESNFRMGLLGDKTAGPEGIMVRCLVEIAWQLKRMNDYIEA